MRKLINIDNGDTLTDIWVLDGVPLLPHQDPYHPLRFIPMPVRGIEEKPPCEAQSASTITAITSTMLISKTTRKGYGC